MREYEGFFAFFNNKQSEGSEFADWCIKKLADVQIKRVTFIKQFLYM